MKQVTLRLRDGVVDLLEVPAPTVTPDGVLVDVRASVLSIGTERSKVLAGRRSLVGKARARPDQVRQVVDRLHREGVSDTIQTVRSRLDQPMALGYSAAGVVLEVGDRVRGLWPGDRVACGGGDHAVHADMVVVPGNLCARLPPEVDFESGAFSTVASVAMHGVRQADVRIGERVAVIGLGLIGQLTGQILRAAGCAVIGIDVAQSLVEKAREVGSIDRGYVRSALETPGVLQPAADCDAVIVTAATASSDPIHLAAKLLRDRGRVVVVGDVRIDVPRAAFYDREIDLRFSRSYGPGRYDREYEERGLDYPIGYVRWTEQRNMAAFLALLASGRLRTQGLVLERVPVQQAAQAYDRLISADTSLLGIVLEYGPSEQPPPLTPTLTPTASGRDSGLTVNVIGAGSFAQRILIPGLQKAGFTLGTVASRRGLTATAAADRFGFARVAGVETALADVDAGLVAIATRHSSHAALAESALRAGKSVFVEKPPCLSFAELDALRAARTESGQELFVGFNRRYAPLAVAMRDHVRASGSPIELLYRVSAGALAPGHWLSDPEDGGGRLLGEGCHFVDFACWMVDSAARSVAPVARRQLPSSVAPGEGFALLIDFDDGSIATILYAVGGAPGLAKEYVEAHADGRSACLEDYRRLHTYQGRRRRTKRAKQDKGHLLQLAAIASGAAPPRPDPLLSMELTLRAREALLGQRKST